MNEQQQILFDLFRGENKKKILNNKNLEIWLDKKGDVELYDIWKEVKFPAVTESSFAKAYDLNQGNFSRWKRGLKPSNKNKDNVIKFLIEINNGLTEKEYFDKIRKNKKAKDEKKSVHVKKYTPVKDESFILDPEGNVSEIRRIYQQNDTPTSVVVERIEKRSKKGSLKAVIFVDMDQVNVRGMKVIADNKSISSNIEVVGISGQGALSVGYTYYFDEPWFSLIVAQTRHKDAADLDFTIVATILNSYLEEDIDFAFVSNDHFVQILKDRLSEFDKRNIYVVAAKSISGFLSKRYL
jgi:hypothetical protein